MAAADKMAADTGHIHSAGKVEPSALADNTDLFWANAWNFRPRNTEHAPPTRIDSGHTAER
jgi:hypothetical protein